MGRAASYTDSVFSPIVIREFNVGEVSVVFCDTQNDNVTTLLGKLFGLSVKTILNVSYISTPLQFINNWA